MGAPSKASFSLRSLNIAILLMTGARFSHSLELSRVWELEFLEWLIVGEPGAYDKLARSLNKNECPTPAPD